MDSKSREFLLSEFIGRRLLVVSSADRGRQGTRGKVLDETRNSFLLGLEGGKRALVPKKGSVFEFEGKITVEGDEIMVRPEDRTKALAKKLSRR